MFWIFWELKHINNIKPHWCTWLERKKDLQVWGWENDDKVAIFGSTVLVLIIWVIKVAKRNEMKVCSMLLAIKKTKINADLYLTGYFQYTLNMFSCHHGTCTYLFHFSYWQAMWQEPDWWRKRQLANEVCSFARVMSTSAAVSEAGCEERVAGARWRGGGGGVLWQYIY